MWNLIRQKVWQWRSLGFTTLLMFSAVVGLRLSGALQDLEWVALDAFFQVRPLDEKDDRIVVVTIGEADITQFGEWPISDQMLAEALDIIRQQNPRAIGLDLYRNFPVEPGYDQLVEVFESTPNLIGIEKVVGGLQGEAIAPPPSLAALDQANSSDLVIDEDGVVRRALLSVRNLEGDVVLSFAARIALLYLEAEGIDLEVVDPANQHIRLGQADFFPLPPNVGGYVDVELGGYQILSNFYRFRAPYASLPLSDVLAGRIPSDLMRDRIVLIGGTAASLGDRFTIPIRNQYSDIPGTPGVFIHAEVVNQILDAALDGRPLLRTWPQLYDYLWILVWTGLGAKLGWTRRSPHVTILGIVLSASSLTLVAFWLFLAGWWVPFVPSLMALGGAATLNKGYGLWDNLLQSKQKLQDYAQTLEEKVSERTQELQEKNQQLQQEIRDRQQAETELSLLFTAMTDTIIVFDAEGRYLKYMQSDPQRSYKLGIQRIGRTVRDILPQHTADLFIDAITRALYLQRLSGYIHKHPNSSFAKYRDITVEYSLPIQDKTVWFSANISPLSDNTVLWVGRDISVRKQTELALQEAKNSAENANRAKSQFLATMSHELRTPLNAVLGFAQLLLRESDLSDSQRDSLDIINRSGEHLLGLINDILTMSKIEAGRARLDSNCFDLHELLDTLYQMFRLRTETKGITLLITLSTDLPRYVIADEGKLRQVLINLLGNAVKFTASGSVCLRATLDETGKALPPADPDAPGSENTVSLRFEVEDTGVGISDGEIAKLFQPFEQTESGRRSHQGTGLGLAISRQFIRLMGGDIDVKSHIDQGSLFFFHIPVELVQQPKLRTSQPESIVALREGQPTYRILVAEDQPENRKLLQRLLESIGFEVCCADNGVEAVETWVTWQPHLIFMDIQMPDMNGYEATQIIRQKFLQCRTDPSILNTELPPPPKIIALTAHAFEEEQSTMRLAGCDGLIIKPFQENTIFEAIATHLSVEYQYEQPPQTPGSQALIPTVVTPNPSAINLQHLSVMSRDWVENFHNAATCVDEGRLLAMVQDIPADADVLSSQLTQWIHNFRFDWIVELTNEYLSDRPSQN